MVDHQRSPGLKVSLLVSAVLRGQQLLSQAEVERWGYLLYSAELVVSARHQISQSVVQA